MEKQYGYDDGYGDGDGGGYGDGDGYSYGYSYGDGDGYSYGYSYGYGDGDGYGYGDGYGDGDGYGYGYGKSNPLDIVVIGYPDLPPIKYIEFLAYCKQAGIDGKISPIAYADFPSAQYAYGYFYYILTAGTLEAYAHRRQEIIEKLTQALQVSGIPLPE